MSRVLKAITYSAIGQYSVQIMSFASVIILSRLMTPAEIGVFAIATSVYLLATEFRTMGVAQFLIREKSLDEQKIRSALGMIIAASWSLGLLTILLAPLVADFYSHPDLTDILLIMSISFFIGPFTSIPYALWMREMQFRPRFYQNFLSTLVRTLTAVLLVLMGFSYFGLAIASVAGVAVELAVAIIFRPSGVVWLPSFSWVADLLRFSLYTTATNLCSRFTVSIPDLVIGRMATMADVGIFSRGVGVIQFAANLMFSAIKPVILPHLSEVNRSGESVEDAYLRTIKLQAAISWPILAVISIAAYPLVMALFGDQWVQAAPVASILAFGLIIGSVHFYGSSALLAKGAEKAVFIIELAVSVVRFAGVVVAVPFGLEMAAWAIVFSSVVDLMLKTIVIRKVIGVRVQHLITTLVPNMVITLVCWSVALLIDQIMSFEKSNVWSSILVLAIFLPPTWLMMLRLTRHEAWDLMVGIAGRIWKRIVVSGR